MRGGQKLASRWADDEDEVDQGKTKTSPSKGLEASKWADSGDEEEEERPKEKVELKPKNKKEGRSPKKSPKKHVNNRGPDQSHDNHMGQPGRSLAQRLSPRKDEEAQKPVREKSPTPKRSDKHSQHHRAREAAHSERERNRLRKLQGPKRDWDKDINENRLPNEQKPENGQKSKESNIESSRPPPKTEEKPLSKEELDKMFKDLATMQTVDWDDDDL